MGFHGVTKRHLLPPLLAGFLLTGCAGDPSLPPETLQFAVEPPASWSADHGNTGDAAGRVSDRWLQELHSPQLAQVVDEALRHNHDLQIAALNWRSAQQSAAITSTNLRPTVEGGLSAKRARSLSSSDTASTSERYQLDLTAVWEIDLWQRLSDQQRAAVALEQAAATDLEAARLSLVAEVAQRWFAAIEAKQQTQLAGHQLDSDLQALEVIEERYRNGLVDALDLHLARSEAATAEERLTSKKMEQQELLRKLEILLGRYPAAELETAGALPDVGEAIPAGLPSDLLQRRPDISASNKRLAAAGLDAEVASRNRLPSFSLTAKGGTSSLELHNLLDWDYLIWSLLGDLTQPLFQQEKLKAEEMLEKIDHQEAWIDHAQTILVAFREVEDALAADHYHQLRVASLARAATESHHAAVLALSRYQNGLIDILALLDAKKRAYDHESTRLKAVANRIENRIALHLALGGSFEQGVETVADKP